MRQGDERSRRTKHCRSAENEAFLEAQATEFIWWVVALCLHAFDSGTLTPPG